MSQSFVNSSGRDEILANFQACTGIEDHEEAVSCLNSCKWDLHEAINKIFPEQPRQESNNSSPAGDFKSLGSSLLQSYSTSSSELVDVIGLASSPSEERKYNYVEPYSGRPVNPQMSHHFRNEAFGGPSSSKSKTEVLDIYIKVRYEDKGNENCPFPVEIPESTTVGELKTLLHNLLGIPPCSQVLEGFVKKVSSHSVISRDVLPKDMTLTLTTGSELIKQKGGRPKDEPAVQECTLLIHDEKNGKDYTLPYPYSKLIKDIKTDMFHLSSIPVRHQLWGGWPVDISDTATLESAGVSSEHHLTVTQQETNDVGSKKQFNYKAPKNISDVSEENSSTDEFEDASELLPDFLVLDDVPTSQTSQPLIPPNVNDEVSGVVSFVDEFQNRYGNCVPQFYQGTLTSALKESVMLPAKSRKPLAIYLHHDKSVLANVFCTQSLCHMSVVSYLTENFITWGWDLTYESNKMRLINLVSLNLGVMLSNTIKNYGSDKLPALLIIYRSRGSIEILSVISGNAILDEVMTSLMNATEIFNEQIRTEMVEENLREQRETVKAEQDAAYHASLEADRAKAQAKRKAELEEQVERERQQSIKEHEDAMKEAVRASLEMDLPPEPPSDCGEPTTVLRFRVPQSEPFDRVFTLSTPLQVVLNYLCVKGYPPDEYKYLQTWPRRCLTTLDASKSLGDLKIPNQETFTVEERTECQND